MTKVLMVTHHFPGPGGLRFHKFAQHLPRLGYEPIILTTRESRRGEKEPSDGLTAGTRIFRTACMHKSPFRIFSRLFNSWDLTVYFESLFFLPDLYANWISSALPKAVSIIKAEKIPLVVTTSPPESVHLLGLVLKKLTGVKWAADFQDLWTTKEIIYRPPTRVHDLIIKRLESAVYAQCDHLIANTEGNSTIYQDLFGISPKKITVIPNGFDGGETVKPTGRHAEPSRFTVGYMGFFDKDGFPWRELLLAVKGLADAHPETTIRLEICGHLSHEATRFIEREDCSHVVAYHGNLPHAKAFQIVSATDALVLLLYHTSYSKAIVPHKLYYYLAMSKPVIAIAEEGGEVDDIIKRTRTGKVVRSEVAEIRKTMEEYYQEWRQNGTIPYEGDSLLIQEYEYGRLARKLKEMMDSLLAVRIEGVRGDGGRDEEDGPSYPAMLAEP